jgi:RNA polymerase sigma-70 factor (ECF subfamily)
VSDPFERLVRIAREERGVLVAAARAEGLAAEDALEAVQDAIATFLTTTPERDTPGETRATLITMTRNAARNARRRHHRALPHVTDHEVPASDADAEALVAHAEDVVRLQACVASLCTIQRSVVMLRLLEERSGEDVATMLGVTRGHVDVLVHRAKASLRVCMRHGA